MILGVDPAVRDLGWCIHDEHQVLDVGVLSSDGLLGMIGAAKNAFCGLAVDMLIIETPQFYAPGKSRVNYNKLAKVSVACGAIAGIVTYERLRLVTPYEWKKSVPKDIHNKRTLSLLSNNEKQKLEHIAKGKAHNALDAVGIIKWHLKNQT